MSKTKLFCLPFAGGNKYSYRMFEDNAPDSLSIVPLEFPGRGARSREPFIKDMQRLVHDMYSQLRPQINDQPYAVYGHSMGGIAAFMLCRKIFADESFAPPLHLFVSGSHSPARQKKDNKQRHLLSKNDFIEEMRNLNGIPEEILQNEDLLNFFEPILRVDFETAETFRYRQQPPMDLPITVMTGTEEDFEDDDIQLWQQETLQPVDFRQFEGKHFFINQHAHPILHIISEKLLLTTNLYQ
ncbi:MAG: thioesterase domain-containing protein [Chitinophagaceae bacterium]